MTLRTQSENGFTAEEQTPNPRRRSLRVTIGIPVTVYFELKGVVESVLARTITVNDYGALLMCPRIFATYAQMDIESGHTSQRRRCRVPCPAKVTREGFEVPIEFEGPSNGFWGISFPGSAQGR